MQKRTLVKQKPEVVTAKYLYFLLLTTAEALLAYSGDSQCCKNLLLCIVDYQQIWQLYIN